MTLFYFLLALLSPVVGVGLILACRLAMEPPEPRFRYFWYSIGIMGMLITGIAPMVFTALALVRCFG